VPWDWDAPMLPKVPRMPVAPVFPVSAPLPLMDVRSATLTASAEAEDAAAGPGKGLFIMSTSVLTVSAPVKVVACGDTTYTVPLWDMLSFLLIMRRKCPDGTLRILPALLLN
jgi:hypothetical protein